MPETPAPTTRTSKEMLWLFVVVVGHDEDMLRFAVESFANEACSAVEVETMVHHAPRTCC